MKCDNCGNTNFYKVNIIDDQCTEGHVYQRVDAFACDNCGLIKLFVPSQALQNHHEQLKKQELLKQEKEKFEKEKLELEERIRTLQIIIDDENQTVKTVKQAKEEQTLIQNELRKLKDNYSIKTRTNRP